MTACVISELYYKIKWPMQFQFCPSVKRYDKAHQRIHQAKAVNRFIFLKWVSRAIIMMRTWKSNSIYIGFLRILKVLYVQKNYMDFWLIQWAFWSVEIFMSRIPFLFLNVVCIDLFKFFGHPISYCPTNLGVANLLTALVVSGVANLEANLGALPCALVPSISFGEQLG